MIGIFLKKESYDNISLKSLIFLVESSQYIFGTFWKKNHFSKMRQKLSNPLQLVRVLVVSYYALKGKDPCCTSHVVMRSIFGTLLKKFDFLSRSSLK